MAKLRLNVFDVFTLLYHQAGVGMRWHISEKSKMKGSYVLERF